MSFRHRWLLLAAPLLCLAQQGKEIRATTDDGRAVILRPDGTWVAVAKPADTKPVALPAGSPEKYSKPGAATRKVTSSFGDFALWVDPARWTETKRDQGRITFQHKNGQAYAMFISEALSVPTEDMKSMVLTNARNADPDVRVTSEEKRNVNGRDVLCLQLEGKVQGLPFRYYGYYYGGSSGNLQLVTYTLQSAFAANQRDFTDLLNGLTVSDRPVEPSSEAETSASKVVPLNDGKLTITPDRQKWSSPKKQADGRLMLTHTKGGGYAIIVSEALDIPLEALPEVALSTARNADPEAKIVSQEKRTVNGLEVWAVKIAVTASKVPFIFYSYDYGGPEGTVQVITYTTPSSFADYEADFNELLNSLSPKK